MLKYLLFLLAVPIFAQTNAQTVYVTNTPSGACSARTNLRLLTPTGSLYTCQSGTWGAIGGGGGGSCSGLAGDVTGTCAANSVVKVNNAAVPTLAGALGTDANGALIAVTPSGGTTPGYGPASGCGVEYVSGLTFNVGACTYTIGGVQYTSPTTSVTLSAADPSNPRIDVIHVNNASVVSVLVGTPAATPAQPSVDYSTELPLNIVLVPAGSSTPGGIAATTIYDENTEWTSTCSTHLNCASTSNPFRGTKDIEATAAVLGNNFTLVKPTAGTTDLSTLNTLIFYIRSKAQWPTANNTGSSGLRTLSLFWLNGSTQVGVQVVIKDGAFGFSSSNTTGYQQISIPLSNFGTGSSLVTTLKAQVTGNGGTSSFGWYIDAVSIQSGQAPLTLPATLMNFKGTWSSTANYNINDEVVYGKVSYVAVAATSNNTPPNATYWQPQTTLPLKSCTFYTSSDSATALTTISGNCPVYEASTITEVDVSGGTGYPGSSPNTYTGTSSFNIQKNHGGTPTTLLSGALATVSGVACAKATTSATCVFNNGMTSSNSVTVSTTALAAGDILQISAFTADTVQTWYTVTVWFSVN